MKYTSTLRLGCLLVVFEHQKTSKKHPLEGLGIGICKKLDVKQYGLKGKGLRNWLFDVFFVVCEFDMRLSRFGHGPHPISRDLQRNFL